MMIEQDLELEREAEEFIKNNQPKFVISSSTIINRFSELKTNMKELYSSRYNLIDDKSLEEFIQSELNRISIIYYSNLAGVEVTISQEHESLRRNTKKSSLLTEKYNESYIADLIDPIRSSLKSYLYHFIDKGFKENFDNEMVRKEVINESYADIPGFNGRVKRSARIANNNFETYLTDTNKQFSAAFMNND